MIDPFGVEVLSGRVPYADGSESAVLEILTRAIDVSSSSDELAAAISDWPTRYHFSRLRRNILSPLRISSETRVLEIGCGTGPILRAIGETGATAVGVEGNLERARSARQRCRDLPNVTVACGTLDDVDAMERFDLILLVGVLEYSAAMTEAADGALGLLQRAAARLKPGGAVVVAIENQLGLKYLLGYPEDHLGVPWAGLRGYAEGGVRTWSRSALRRLLESAGLPAQRWLYAFPDYKLPLVLLDDMLLERENSSELVCKLVRIPVRDFSGSSPQIVDEHRALAVLSEAGLVAETANSFLVIATAEGAAPAAHLHDALAFLHSDERATGWARARRLVAVDERLMLVNAAGSDTTTRVGWLEQRTAHEEPFHEGANLEDLIIDSFSRGDAVGAAKLLGLWREQLEAGAVPLTGNRVASSPWIDAATEIILPPDAVDLTPRNILVTDSQVHVVDREWTVDGGCDIHLIAYRACCYLAYELLRRHIPGAWPSTSSVAEVAEHLLHLVGLPLIADAAQRWAVAEGELQARVGSADPAEMARHLRAMYATRPVLAPRAVPLAETPRLLDENSRLREQLLAQRSEITDLAARAETSRSSADVANAEIRGHVEQLDRLKRQIEQLEAELAARPNGTEYEELQAEVARFQSEVALMTSSQTWRVGSMLARPVRIAKRLRR